MQTLNFSALLLLLGTAHAMVTLSPTDLVAYELMTAANLTSGETTENYRSKRQSSSLRRFTADEFNQCQAVGGRVACESGLQQELHTLALQCQQQVTADAAEFACGVNSDGVYCAQGAEISAQFESRTMASCTTSSCSSSCRSAISDLNRELGCCSGYWTQALSGTNTNLDGNVWSACSVTPGELCPIPTFNSTVTNSRPCSLDETNRILFNHRCMQENSGPIVEAVANVSGCRSVAEVLTDVCDVDLNGNLCAFQTGQTTGTLTPFIQNCALDVSSSSCSSSCRNSMIAFRNDVGCCMNTLYNGTLIRVFPGNIAQFEQLLSFFTNDFWERCNVVTPGICDSLLTVPASTTQAPTTQARTTQAPTTQARTTQARTTQARTTQAPTTQARTTQARTTQAPTTQARTTEGPTTQAPTTQARTTQARTTEGPTTQARTTQARTTQAPTTQAPTTQARITEGPTTCTNKRIQLRIQRLQFKIQRIQQKLRQLTIEC